GPVGTAVKLVEQHVERALIARPAAVVHAARPAGHVPLDLRRPERLALSQAPRQRRQRVERWLHRSRRGTCGHDVNTAPSARGARILRVHRRDRRDAPLLRDLAGERAGQAVAPRAERGTRHQHVGLESIELGADRARGFCLAFAGEVVAAHDGRLDARAVAQRLLEQPARADGARARRAAPPPAPAAAPPRSCPPPLTPQKTLSPYSTPGGAPLLASPPRRSSCGGILLRPGQGRRVSGRALSSSAAPRILDAWETPGGSSFA